MQGQEASRERQGLSDIPRVKYLAQWLAQRKDLTTTKTLNQARSVWKNWGREVLLKGRSLEEGPGMK